MRLNVLLICHVPPASLVKPFPSLSIDIQFWWRRVHDSIRSDLNGFWLFRRSFLKDSIGFIIHWQNWLFDGCRCWRAEESTEEKSLTSRASCLQDMRSNFRNAFLTTFYGFFFLGYTKEQKLHQQPSSPGEGKICYNSRRSSHSRTLMRRAKFACTENLIFYEMEIASTWMTVNVGWNAIKEVSRLCN